MHKAVTCMGFNFSHDLEIFGVRLIPGLVMIPSINHAESEMYPVDPRSKGATPDDQFSSVSLALETAGDLHYLEDSGSIVTCLFRMSRTSLLDFRVII